MEKVYIFGNEATAEAFKLTAYHFGYEGQRIGSALMMPEKVYKTVLENTYAVSAAIIATIEEKP